jgi:hypothetical protein
MSRSDAAALRELVRLIRASNECDEGSDEARRRADELSGGLRFSREPLDATAAIHELRDLSREVSPELRYALARWIAGRIALKRGRKPTGGDKRQVRPSLAPLSPRVCIRALLEFGATTKPTGVHLSTRRALAELLAGARKLKRGPTLAPPSTAKTMFAAIKARRYAQTMNGRPAIRRAAAEAGIKYGTLQRYLYPRSK